MNKNKKQRITLGATLIAIVAAGGIGYKLGSGFNIFEKLEEKKNKIMAMYVEDESGTFRVSNSKTFPTDGYVLDHADCTNGGIVIQDSETKKISAKFSKAGSCNLYFAIEKLPSTGEPLIAKANDISVTNYNSGIKEEMFTFDHNVSSTDSDSNTYIASQISSWSESERRDYRYIGANPNNWIRFNDEDWRIIGVFTVEKADGGKEQLMKIIRNESIGNIKWSSSNINEWSNSSLYTLLNTGDYYNKANTYSSIGLNATAKSQIETVKWYLGGSKTKQNLGGPNYYSFERGTIVYSGRSTNTKGVVGLMYPSEIVYI